MAIKIHLNWDSNNENGIIQNNTYTLGALFEGISRKPVLTFVYDWFNYCEITNAFKISFDGISSIEMTPAQKTEILSLANSWVQLEGEEGNPNADQLAEIKKAEIKTFFDAENLISSNLVDAYEPVTWAIQEVEARAYLLDPLYPTPTLNALVTGRNIDGEGVPELATKIISKADAYVLYYQLLGKLQGKLKLIEAARVLQDKLAITSVTWF